MSWEEVTVMDQRVRFIVEYLKGYFPFNELCFQFSISRKTGYKWVQRYEAHGIEGLTDRTRRPYTCPHKTDTAIAIKSLDKQKQPRYTSPSVESNVLSKTKNSGYDFKKGHSNSATGLLFHSLRFPCLAAMDDRES